MPKEDGAALPEKADPVHPLFASAEDYAIFTMDSEGVVLDWNRGARKIKGYSDEEMAGRHFSCFYTEEDRALGLPGKELETAASEGSWSGEGWRLRKDGSRFRANVTITALRGEGDKVAAYLKITRDLTARMLATEALRESEERFRLLLEGVREYAIFMLDPEGHVASWNAGARQIKGYEEHEIVGRHFSIFYTPEALATGVPQSLLSKALAEGSAEDENWRVRKDGSRFWGNVLITALYDPRGELRGFAKVTRDLTDRRQIQRLKEKSRRKDVFLATLAHELRNPLAPLLPGLEVILRSPGCPGEVTKVAGVLKRQVDQMARLIDDLLDVSRIATGKIVLRKSRALLADVVGSAVESIQPLIEEKGHDLSVEVPDGVEIEADPHRIAQVVSNLLSNAAKYTPPGGRVSIVATAESADAIRILVKDNGRGIEPHRHGEIFELFEQGISGAEDGLGLGLTLVKNLVEMHGGTVSVASEGAGRGTEIGVFLPIRAGAAIGKKEAGAEEIRSRPLRVLVADDGRNAADILALFFQMEGMETVVAYDGAEAVEAAGRFAPDIACLDLGMPKLDGFEAARRIRRMRPGVKLVALSGWGGEEDRVRTAEAGFDLHLVKPVKPEDLRVLLRDQGAVVPALKAIPE